MLRSHSATTQSILIKITTSDNDRGLSPLLRLAYFDTVGKGGGRSHSVHALWRICCTMEAGTPSERFTPCLQPYLRHRDVSGAGSTAAAALRLKLCES